MQYAAIWGTWHRMGVLRPNRRCPCLYAGMLLGSNVEQTLPPASGYVQVQLDGNYAVSYIRACLRGSHVGVTA